MTGETLGVAEYLDFVEREYLTSYIALGGSTVKLLSVADDSTGRELAGGLANLGDDFVHVSVDAATTRVHVLVEVVAEIEAAIDEEGKVLV